jgi:PAS domain S-box-containing protein
MPSMLFLAGAIVLQIIAAALAFRLVRVTGRLSAWVLVSIALVLMAFRRIIPFARALVGDGSAPADPVNEFIGLVLSGFMVAGIAMIGPIFEKIFKAERELRESERRFRSYFELPLIGVAIASEDRRWVTVNDRLCEMLGFSRQELSSMTMGELTCPEDAARELALDRSMSERNAEGYSLDKRFIRRDGAAIWTSQAVRRVRGLDGSVSYYVVILQDITERKAAEEGLRHSLGEKEALLRELYHRTKNNMQMICSLLHLESSQCKDPKLTEEFQVIENRIASMSLVHEMLYASRDLSRIDLSEYIEDLSRLLVQSYEASSSKVAVELDLEHIRIALDTAVPLGLILNELITNSLKYAFPDGRKGRIRVGAARAVGDRIEIDVADDGIGVAAGFDFCSDSGMGLKTVFALAEQIGGDVSFASGSGLECRISFGNAFVAERV